MPRPGFVLEVDERTPPLLVHEGEGFRLQKFPLGTRVVYPPDSLPGIRDVDAAIQHALLHPLGDSKPLPELLTPGMKLTIAFDDISLPLPPMRTPDIRQRIIEHVLELAARKGVDDVELIVAHALHRRMTERRDQAARSASACSVRFLPDAPLQLRRRGPDRPARTSARPTRARTSRSTSGRPSPTCSST